MATRIESTAKPREGSPTSDADASLAIPGGSVHKQSLRSIWAPDGNDSPTTDRFEPSANGPLQPTCGDGQLHGVPRSAGVDILPPLVEPVPTASLHALQEWEGYVTHIGDDEFGAQRVDLTARDSVARDDAVIPLNEVSVEDRLRIEPGSITVQIPTPLS